MTRRFEIYAVLGAPNAGKSTLVNALVGQKVSIVSQKPQTTRSNVLGIFVEQEAQIVLTDTPGFSPPRERLGRAMSHGIRAAAYTAKRALLVVDASRPRRGGGQGLDLLREILPDAQVLLVLNKVDRIPRTHLLPLAQMLNEQFPFRETFMISALKRDGVDHLRNALAQSAPEGAWLYPEDQPTTSSLRLLAAEWTRERIFKEFSQEIPYSCAVETKEWEDFTYKKETRIAQSIYVKKASQVPILLGKEGSKILVIRQLAQKDLATLLERKVHLFLKVEERPNWSEEKEFYDLWGLRYNA
ncbi:MAG: GTPase Era [Holosporales bacterium]|jgi:GTP-binding protein Era|nr:GTPase Era [Holosporales bacterium]